MALPARRPEPGMSDDDLAAEYKAQRIMFAAVAEFRSKVQDAQALTSLFRQDLSDLLDAVDDYVPTENSWNEKINEARHG